MVDQEEQQKLGIRKQEKEQKEALRGNKWVPNAPTRKAIACHEKVWKSLQAAKKETD